jgi:hypothetical protein
MSKARLALATVVLVLLAGCGTPTGPPVDARTVPQEAPSQAGDGDYELTLRVLEAGADEPLTDAAVVVYWGTADGEASGSVDLSGTSQGGSEGGEVSGVVRVSNPSTPEPETTLTMRTDDSGTVRANVPANRVVGIVAWSEGYTQEWIPQAVTGDADTGGPVDFPLYQSEIVETSEGEIGPAGASPGRASDTNYDWYPEQAPWGEDNATHAGYVERLTSLRATLTWTNGPDNGGGGDLSIGIGTSSSDPDHVQESDDAQAEPGEHTEEAALDHSDVEELDWPQSDRLYVGPATSSSYAGPTGLGYELKTEASFSPHAAPTPDGDFNASPALGAPLAVLGLAGLALLARSRR